MSRVARPKAPSSRPHDHPVKPSEHEQVPRMPQMPCPEQLFISPPGHSFSHMSPHRPASQLQTPSREQLPAQSLAIRLDWIRLD